MTGQVRHRQAGVTLLEIAIGLLVLGVLTAGAADLYNRATMQRRYLVTYDNMDRITTALSQYAETAGRVPCPADPSIANATFGWESGVTAATLSVTSATGPPVGACTNTSNLGIVPFLTLDLTDTQARDGWGHYFTYAVSPVFAQSNDQSHKTDGTINDGTGGYSQTDIGDVHGRCRSEGWVGRYDVHNISAIKARFCCADKGFIGDPNSLEQWHTVSYDNNTDLVVNFTGGNTLSPTRDTNSANVANLVNGDTTTASSSTYYILTGTALNTIHAGAGVAGLPVAFQYGNTAGSYVTGSKILAPAFILISHGPSGGGAFLANSTRNRAAASGISAQNAVNNANNTWQRTFVDGPVNLVTGVNYYDNIVRWMTQDSLMAAHGAISCSYP